MKRIPVIKIIVFLALLGLGLFLIYIYPFAKGVQEDTVKQGQIKDSILIIDSDNLDGSVVN